MYIITQSLIFIEVNTGLYPHIHDIAHPNVWQYQEYLIMHDPGCFLDSKLSFVA